MPCIFCEIVAGRAPASIVYKDEQVTAFNDLHPRAPTHILIIPNRHIESLHAVTDDASAVQVAKCLRVARDLAEERGLNGGYRIVTNVGADAGQSVFHLHFHLLAGRKMSWPPG
ncbi:MAG TPA: histidine triad nucleotide-binding protein [Anaerolineae bacterium]|nr:histidine triad nucleotide-binding protein [Anaerolineae bacterium]